MNSISRIYLVRQRQSIQYVNLTPYGEFEHGHTKSTGRERRIKEGGKMSWILV